MVSLFILPSLLIERISFLSSFLSEEASEALSIVLISFNLTSAVFGSVDLTAASVDIITGLASVAAFIDIELSNNRENAGIKQRVSFLMLKIFFSECFITTQRLQQCKTSALHNFGENLHHSHIADHTGFPDSETAKESRSQPGDFLELA